MPSIIAAFVLVALPTLDDEDEPFRPEPDRNGVLTLPAAEADLIGDRLRLEDADPPYVADWYSATESVRWDFRLDEPGRFLLLVDYAAPVGRGECLFELNVADQARQAYALSTGGPTRFLPQPLKGTVDLPVGASRLEIVAIEAPRGFVMNLRGVRLVPAED